MFQEEGFRPSDRRGFVHKKLLGLVSKVSGFVPGGDLVSEITGRLAARRRPSRPTVSRSSTARPTFRGAQAKQLGRELKFGGDLSVPQLTGPTFAPQPIATVRTVGTKPRAQTALHDPGPCPPPLIRSGDLCVAPTSPLGASRLVGEATMGRYGAALIPGSQIIDRAVCLPGMQLGNDGLCYNKAAITNNQRMWPRGRRPLLTGGDMNAIAIAARAGAKLERTTKRLRSLGMMKRLPAPRKAAPHAHAKPVAAVSVM